LEDVACIHFPGFLQVRLLPNILLLDLHHGDCKVMEIYWLLTTGIRGIYNLGAACH
jgi:hypothetical protein